MAAEETLKVKIVGEGGQLTKTLGDLTSQLKRFQEGLKTAGNVDSFNRIQRAADATKQRIDALNKTGAGVQKVTKDFTGFSRVIQDLPFGFVAISNNLEQLIPAAGGAGLAFSGLISVLTFASIGFNNWTRGLGVGNESLEDQVKKLNDAKTALANYVELLNDTAKIQTVGAQNAQEELVRLQTLYSATQNANISLSQRKKLVDELQEQYPKYFQNISDETILAGGAKAAYDRLATSILAASRARAGQDILVDLQKESIALDVQHNRALEEEYNAYQRLGEVTKQVTENNKATRGSEAAAVMNQDKLRDAANQYKEAQKATLGIFKQQQSVQERMSSVTKQITSIVEQNPDALLDPTGGKGKTPHVKKDVIVDLSVKHIEPLNTIDDQFAAAAAELSRDVDKNLSKLIEEHLQSQPIKPRVNIAPDVALITPDQAEFAAKLLEFNNQLSEIVTKGQQDLFSSLGKGLGEAITGSGLGAIFENVLGAMGNIIKALGEQLIKAAITIKLFKEAFKALLANPIAALGVGIAMVAVGTAISASANKLKGFAAGGLASGPTLGLIGEGIGTSAANPEVVAPLDKLKNFIAPQNDLQPQVIVHEISGDTLRLWIQRANKKGGRY